MGDNTGSSLAARGVVQFARSSGRSLLMPLTENQPKCSTASAHLLAEEHWVMDMEIPAPLPPLYAGPHGQRSLTAKISEPPLPDSKWATDDEVASSFCRSKPTIA